MAGKQQTATSSWLAQPKPPTDTHLHVHGMPITLDRVSMELLAAKSAKVAALLKEHSEEDVRQFLRNIPAHPQMTELVARFCHGFELQMSSENVVPLACLAYHLGMTESHSPNNLLRRALTFFERRILPSWTETVKALCTTENLKQQAADLGLVDACIKSLVAKAVADPELLGEPIRSFGNGEPYEEEDMQQQKPSARRKLFVHEWASEDLITLSLQLYESTICAMDQCGVPSKYVAASVCKYAKKRLFSSTAEDSTSVYKMNSQREVIQSVERLLPNERGLIPCTLLSEMLRFAVSVEASPECKSGFEMRIGKQLDQATVNDLRVPTKCYAEELCYDIECVRRILKNFYGNYSSSNMAGIISVAELIEEFLVELAGDTDLDAATFTSLAEISTAASMGTARTSDGIYRAVDIYLDEHRYLTESEKEQVCKVLDFQKMSPEACEHAAKNERLPLRMVVQVLFMAQLQLRDAVIREVEDYGDKLSERDSEGDEEKLNGQMMRTEMEKMSNKVMELQRECHMMRREIGKSCGHEVRKEKTSVWREVKRKFGCISKMHNCDCQVKKIKVHPKGGV